MRTHPPAGSPLAPVLPILLLLGCSGPKTPDTGFHVEAEWDSTLDVRKLSVLAVDGDGRSALESVTFDAPFSLEPPGVRSAGALLSVPREMDGARLIVRVEGMGSGGELIGFGREEIVVAAGRVLDVVVSLGLPPSCPDGRARLDSGSCGDGPDLPGGPGRFTRTYQVEALETVTTTRAEFVPMPGARLDFTPEVGGETWLVIASGRLGSTSDAEVSAEMRLLVNGAEVDLFGHQVRGDPENDAGFVSFDLLPAAVGAQRVVLEFRAEGGRTLASDVRIVAAALPRGADAQRVRIDEALEAAGSDVSLAELKFRPASPGTYVVLARASMSESPSNGTVRAWLVDETGARQPDDGRGASFSNARAPWMPTFVALARDLPGGDALFRLAGASAGGGDTSDWWDAAYRFRRRLTVEARERGALEGYAVRFAFDHARAIAAGSARADGRDVRIVRSVGGVHTELPRIVDVESSWGRADTTIWFPLSAPLAGFQADASYSVYYGAASPPPVDEDPSHIFTFFDDFAGEALDGTRWEVDAGGMSLSDGRVQLPPGSAIHSVASFAPPRLLEASLAFSRDPVGPASFWGASNRAGELGPLLGFVSTVQGHLVRAGQAAQLWEPETPLAFHRYAIARPGPAGVEFFQDDFSIAVLPSPTSEALPLYADNRSESDVITYDWVRVRMFLPPEPVVTLGAPDGAIGVEPSRWRARSIVAFRADAFARFEHASTPELSTTTSTTFEPKTILVTEAPPSRSEYLVIQSMRISGESSDTARKEGILRASGRALLSTHHRINRDSSGASGYHHTAGVAHVLRTGAAVTYENGFASPEGIAVDAAASSILVLRYPP